MSPPPQIIKLATALIGVVYGKSRAHMTTRVSGITGPHVRLLPERLQLHFLQLLLVGSNKCIKIPLKRVPSINPFNELCTLENLYLCLDN